MSSARITICFVCMGNICRSPMAEAVTRERLRVAGLANRVRVESAGTGDWHVGHDADERARAVLRRHGYPLAHIARQFDSEWFERFDLVVVMDTENLATILFVAADDDERSKVHLLRSFDPALAGKGPDAQSVPDPYYGGGEGFERVLAMIERAVDGLLEVISTKLVESSDQH
jgi:protein-tyrosine phosphatase